MFKNLVFFRIDADCLFPDLQALETAAAANPFVPCEPTVEHSSGWVPASRRDAGAMVESVGSQWILRLRTQSRSVPAAAVKAEVEARCKKIEDEQGVKLGRGTRKTMAEEVKREMLPRAFPKNGETMVWIDRKNRVLAVEAGSFKKADAVVSVLANLFPQAGAILKARTVNTKASPSLAMSTWLSDQEAPCGLNLERECELKDVDGEGATVRYTKHNLEIDEIRKHIEHGKRATRVALSLDGRIAFTLTGDLVLRKIEILEAAVKEQGNTEADAAEFEGNVALVTGELQRLIPVVIEALDGELAEQTLGVPEAESSYDPLPEAA